jgi:acetone carboxylase alpha subunit
MVWNAHDWTMFFMGNGYMNSDWGLMGGYPSASGYRFEAHKTGLAERVADGQPLPLGADFDPDHPTYEKNLDKDAKVKRDKQCITTEDCYDNYDLYLNYLRGGPGFGDPLDREPQAIAADLNQGFLLPEYAQKVYGAVIAQDTKGRWTVDADKTADRRKEIREERLVRSVPTGQWMATERKNILDKRTAIQVKHMYATSFGLSPKFLTEFRTFWNLPEDWNLTEDELGIPSYGSKYRMDLSLMPDVRTVVQVEE